MFIDVWIEIWRIKVIKVLIVSVKDTKCDGDFDIGRY